MPIPGRVALATVMLALAPLGCFREEPPPADWARCAVNSDCVLRADSCCAPCGAPGLDDVDAVHQARTEEHFRDVCPSPTPCPLCPVANNPDLLATCEAWACEAVDIRRHFASTCASDDDCRLRVAGCCECGGSTAPADLIAIAWLGEAGYRQLVCDPEQACPECAPVYPDEVEAWCASDGHCDIRAATGCDEDCATVGLSCCAGRCVATYNDIFNCGACGVVCSGEHPYCAGTACGAPPCVLDGCPPPALCCGDECCADGALCCTVPGPGPASFPSCVVPDETATCPIGCPLCV